jgi:hypothetical protein
MTYFFFNQFSFEGLSFLNFYDSTWIHSKFQKDVFKKARSKKSGWIFHFFIRAPKTSEIKMEFTNKCCKSKLDFQEERECVCVCVCGWVCVCVCSFQLFTYFQIRIQKFRLNHIFTNSGEHFNSGPISFSFGNFFHFHRSFRSHSTNLHNKARNETDFS